MELTKNVGIRNRFDIEVYDTVTEETTHYQATNIVLDAMWSRLVNFQTYFVNIHYGTGTGSFASSSTSLFTHKGTKAATTHETVKALPTSRWVRRIVLNPEEEVGTTFTEVGVAYSSTASNLVTHAAIADAEGNPITLTKTATQVLTIYATIYIELGEEDAMYDGKVRWVQPIASANELVNYLTGSSYPTQAFRVSGEREWSNGVAPVSFAASSGFGPSGWTANASTKKATTPVQRFGTTAGNGEVRCLGIGSSDSLGTMRAQVPVTGVYTSKAITGEALGTGDALNAGFNLSWADAQSVIVKTDGVTVNTLDYTLRPAYKNQNLFLRRPVATVAGTPESPQNLTDGVITTSASGLPTGSVVGIDVGASYATTNVSRLRTYSNNSGVTIYLRGSANADFSESVAIGSGATVSGNWFNINFSPVSYRYYTLSSASYVQLREVELLAADDQITFTTPPALGAAITADYTVDYIPKDTKHVLDLQCAIQYGEPT